MGLCLFKSPKSSSKELLTSYLSTFFGARQKRKPLARTQDFKETRACRRSKEDLLNYELREKKSLRLKYKESYETARCRLQETLSPPDLNHTCSTIEAKSSKLKDRLSKKLDKKFNVLKQKKGIHSSQTWTMTQSFSIIRIVETKKSVLIVLPFLGHRRKHLTKQLRSCINKFYGIFNVPIVFQDTRRIKSFLPYKDKLAPSFRSKVVYRANCWDCNDFYIGKIVCKLAHHGGYFKALSDFIILILSVRFIAFSKG